MRIDDWYKAALLVSLVVLIAAIVVGRDDVAVIAAGVLIFSFGEWINHPERESFHPGNGYGQAFKFTDKRRSPSLFGTVLDLLGLAIIGYGVWALLSE